MQFVMTPWALLEQARTPEEEAAVLLLCLALDRGRGRLQTSIRSLAETMRLPKSRCHRLLQRLEGTGLIAVDSSRACTNVQRASGGTPVGQWRDTSGTAVGQQWDSKDQESAASSEGSGTPVGQSRDSSGTPVGQSRDSSGTPHARVEDHTSDSILQTSDKEDNEEEFQAVFEAWRGWQEKHDLPLRQPVCRGSSNWSALRARLRDHDLESVLKVIDWVTNSNSWQARHPAAVDFSTVVKKSKFSKYLAAANAWKSESGRDAPFADTVSGPPPRTTKEHHEYDTSDVPF